MDRRLEERRPCSLDVGLTALKNGDTGSGQITDISKSGICIVSSLQFDRDDVVRLELAESKMFGHITYCQAEASSFRTGIEVVQVLVGGAPLSRLLETILAEFTPPRTKDDVPAQVEAEPSEIRLG